ncbi:biotin--[acetyl-CoA-carboxylase] ligase [Thomasclavelia sp.]
MSVKNEIISLLEKNRNNPVSGQAIADNLNVTRAAVWKAIKVLKEEGYIIEGTPNKGYILLENNDILSSQGIDCYLDEEIDIYTYKCLDSTNTQMKKLAIDGGEDHSVVVAEQQSAGRGRFGRNFYSPAKEGIYMSVLLKNYKNIQDATIITIQTAVAVSRAIKRLYGLKIDIKWVNDLYYQGKKICGILTEAISDFESGMIEAIIIGIGINVSTSKFPDELQNKAKSLGLNGANRNQFIAEILKQLFAIINEDFNLVLVEYKELSCVLNKEIEFNIKGQRYNGIARDINEFGNLVVESNEYEMVLSSGEISIVGEFYETK